MKSEKEIKAMLERLEADDRLEELPANIEINAPLAIMQIELSAKIIALRWVLESAAKDNE